MADTTAYVEEAARIARGQAQARTVLAIMQLSAALEALAGHVGRLERRAFWSPREPEPTGMSASAVEHPAHYGGGDNPYEAIKIIQALGFSFELGNCFKYMARLDKKQGANPIEDLEKARWYLDEEIEQWKAGNRGAW